MIDESKIIIYVVLGVVGVVGFIFIFFSDVFVIAFI